MDLYLEPKDYPSSERSWIDELKSIYEESFLAHYGVGPEDNPPGRGSGRYPAGSGDRPNQRAWDFSSRYDKLVKSGMSETEIARAMGFFRTDHNGNVLYDKNGNPLVSTSKLRAAKQESINTVKKDQYNDILNLLGQIDPETGKAYTNTKIAEIVGVTEGTVRNVKKDPEGYLERADKTNQVVNDLKEFVKEGNYVDIGKGAELELGCSPDRLNTALQMLENEGYMVTNIQVPQVGGSFGQKTTIRVLCPPGTDFEELIANKDNIKYLNDISGDGVTSVLGIREPNPIDISRVEVRYKEDGGAEKDGVVEIKAYVGEDGVLYPANPDLSLGNAKYAQVRIAVDGGDEYGPMYIKGMAVYNPDLDCDILVNSNKSVSQGIGKALKEMNYIKDKDGNPVLGDDGKPIVDMDNPFGSSVYQTEYKPGTLSSINIVGDVWGKNPHVEGAWDEWSRNLPSQFLGKQSEELIQQQLRLKVDQKRAEYDEIMSVSNPTVRKQLLLDFAEECDGAAVDLKAAPLAGQRVQVLLPLTTIGENEVYAPNFDNGQTLALVRFPHAGTFEIPIVTVNNNNAEAKKFMEDARGTAKDAIGISSKTAETLSGADFDGDTAIAIPMTRKNFQGEFDKVNNIIGIGNGAQKLQGLSGFDPKTQYAGVDENGNKIPGVKYMTKQQKQNEMGRVSNLITDMQLKGCEDPEELSRAVAYSMVVIDAEKHKLNYKQAYEDYNIKELTEKYQAKPDGTSGGASTLLSKASGEKDVAQRKIGYKIDKDTGEKIYTENPDRFYEEEVPKKVPAPAGSRSKWLKDEKGDYIYEINPKTGRPVYEKTGKIKERTTKTTNMAEAKNAYELLSENPTRKELLYADYANEMKAMANSSRKQAVATPKLEKNSKAAKEYEQEVNELNAALNTAKKNAYRERHAQLVANQNISSRRQDNPYMSDEELKKLKGQALTAARNRTGALKERVTFSSRQIEAINKGAVSDTKLSELLKHADSEKYRQAFMPKTFKVSASTANVVQSLIRNGWSIEQIVDAGYASKETIRQVRSGNYEH